MIWYASNCVQKFNIYIDLIKYPICQQVWKSCQNFVIFFKSQDFITR